MKHVIRPAAKDDILRRFRYYLCEDAPAAVRFLDAVDQSIEAICTMPQILAPKPLKNLSRSGLRFRAVSDFEDMLIFYIVQPEARQAQMLSQ